MPLVPGYSSDAISANIRREVHRGRPQRQAIAIALAHARAEAEKALSRARTPRSRAVLEERIDKLTPRVGASGDRRRWFFWYIKPSGGAPVTHGPESMTDYEAFRLEFATKSQHLGAAMYRFVFDPTIDRTRWIYDTRTTPQLMAGEPIRVPYA